MSRRLSVLVLSAGLLLLAAGSDSGPSARATVTIHHSHFEPDVLRVPAGVPVTIMLRNEDPIDHEWIVGPPDVHERHRTGTEPFHNSIPTEVTIPALSTRVTTITFPRSVAYAYICHLPGHEAYGMVGTLRAVAR